MNQRHWWHYLKWTKNVSHIQGSPGLSTSPHWAMPNFRLNLNFYCWPVSAIRLLQGGSGNERRIERRIWSLLNLSWFSEKCLLDLLPLVQEWERLDTIGGARRITGDIAILILTITIPRPQNHLFLQQMARNLRACPAKGSHTGIQYIFFIFIYFQLCYTSIFDTSLSHTYIFVLKLNFQVHPNLVAREDALEYVEVLFFEIFLLSIMGYYF